MKNTNKKGFTLVELVIVIAVIAILAGVLIATFASVIKRANQSAEVQNIKNAEIAQKAEDIIKKIEEANWFGWEDFEVSLVEKLTKAYKDNATATIDDDAIKNAVKDAVTDAFANMSIKTTDLSAEEVKAIIENALGTVKYEGVTEAQVRAIVKAATSEVTVSQLTPAQVKAIVNAATTNNLTQDDVARIIGRLGLATDVNVDSAVESIKTTLTTETSKLATKEQAQDILDAINEYANQITTNDLDDVITAKALNIRIKNAGLTSANTPYDVVSTIEATDSELKNTILLSIEAGQLGFFVIDENRKVVNPCGLTITVNPLDKTVPYKYWTFANTVSSYFSTYLKAVPETVAPDGVGLDVGKQTVTAINYTNTTDTARNVVIRTNGGTLNIGTSEADAAGKIVHYGTLDEAIVYTTSNSFHTHGKIASMDLKTGLAVAEDKGYVALVKAAAGTEIEEKDTGIFYIPSTATTATVDATVAATLGYTVTETETTANETRTAKIDSTVYQIDNKYDLIAFRDNVNAGNTFAGITVKLNADIDLDGVDWTPIGLYKDLDANDVKVKFSGTFDGQNHIIDNMHIIAYSANHNTYRSSYRALFGYTNGIIKNFTVKGSIVGADCAGVVAALDAGGQILNVNSYVTLTGQTGKKGGSIPEYQDNLQGKIGGICLTVKGTNGYWKIENCNNYGNIVATNRSNNDGAGGIIAWSNEKIVDPDNNLGIFINNCRNYGNVISQYNMPAGGISGATAAISITNCCNEGTISSIGVAGGIAGNLGRVNDNNNSTQLAYGTNSHGDAILINCENKGSVSGTTVGGIASYSYRPKTILHLVNSGSISGTGVCGEIFGVLEQADVDANEFTFTKAKPAIGSYQIVNVEVTKTIENADDFTVGKIAFKTAANYTSTLQIKNSTFTELKCNTECNHTAIIELNNSSITTLNINAGYTATQNDTVHIKEITNTTNSLTTVNYLGNNTSANNTLSVYLGIACTFNYNGSGHAKFVNALDGYTVTNPSSNVWVATKNS